MNPWTNENVDMLRKMWGEGATAGEIAGALGREFTRNSVIGKVQRLKLDKRSRFAVHQSSALSVRAADARKRSPKQKGRDAGIITRMRHQSEKPVILPDELPGDELSDGVDVTGLIGIMQLREDTCRWPVGDPLKPGFGFCGQAVPEVPEGQRRHVYCDHHHSKAYQQR